MLSYRSGRGLCSNPDGGISREWRTSSLTGLRIKSAAEERERYHIVSYEDLMSAITHRDIPLVVIHPSIMEYDEGLTPSETRAFREAVNANYSLISDVDEVAIWRRR